MVEGLGGEVEVKGYLSTEARARMGSEKYLTQWLNRLEINGSVKYKDVGPFRELSLVTIIRPEYDVAQDYGSSLTDGRVGRDADKPSYLGNPFNYNTDGVGFGGFDPFPAWGGQLGATGTGGLWKNVTNGIWDPAKMNQFETILNHNAVGGVYTNNGNVNRSLMSAFPLVAAIGNTHLNCQNCQDVNNSFLDTAMNNTDSSGRLYPFRELFVDAVTDNWWFRIGKQQVVWGKADFFRMQDIVNPVDFGQHFFFDSFEDIRIPQWIANVQYKAGDIGFLTDNAFTVVWNFDRFQRVGLGSSTAAWAHPFSKDLSVFANFNTYFSVDPCLSAANEQLRAANFAAAGGTGLGATFQASHVCGAQGPHDPRLPSGFGQPVGTAYEKIPEWSLENTQGGGRWEFRAGELHMALSYYNHFQDTPVFRFHTINMLQDFGMFGGNSALATANLGANGKVIADLAGGALNAAGGVANPSVFGINGTGTGLINALNGPGGLSGVGANLCQQYQGAECFRLRIVEPKQAFAFLAAGNPATSLGLTDPLQNVPLTLRKMLSRGKATNVFNGQNLDRQATYADAAKYALATKDATQFYRYSASAGSGLTGGQTDIMYEKEHTVGLSFDYFEGWSGVVLRVESSFTPNSLVTDTMEPDWVGHSDILRWSMGFDRPTFIKLLNKDRTFFLSAQIFDTYYLDYHTGVGSDEGHTGMLTNEHNYITTFFFQTHYMRDKIIPLGFLVWEESSNAWVGGFNTEWLIDNHWSIKGGFHIISGDGTIGTHDAGPFTAFIQPVGLSNSRNPNQVSGWNRPAGSFDYLQQGPLGVAHEGIAALDANDEVFFQVKYQF
ncbi:MAG: hypothetical protein HY749_12510 [Gammaproteobacteria bacterium]|nr:hypothetical protein [Gammaproteobacteria bacterium]MBI5616105.1 hypothetical protein [Gammaproteobacteria bacterium]